MYQTLRNLRQKIVMLKIKLQPYTMNIIFIYNQYFNKMDKLLLNGVGTLGSVFSTYTVGLFSLILIGVSLLIILYRILKWIIKVNENTLYLKEVLQTYKQLQEEKEKETKKTSKKSMIDKIGNESSKEAADMAFDIINVCQELLGEQQFESVDQIVSSNL